MLKEESVMEISILHRQGESIRGIARQLGVSRNTVRAYLRQDASPVYGPRLDRASELDPYKPYIEQRLAAARPHWVPASVIDREIRHQGYSGSIRLLRYYMATLKPVAGTLYLRLWRPWAGAGIAMWNLSAMSVLPRSRAVMKTPSATSRVCPKRCCMTI